MSGRYWSCTLLFPNIVSLEGMLVVHGCVPQIKLAYAALQHSVDKTGWCSRHVPFQEVYNLCSKL